MTLAADGDWSGAVAALEVALRRGDAVDDLDVLGNPGNAALQLGGDKSHRRFHTLMLSRARESGAVVAVVCALQRLAFGHLLAGEWAALRSVVLSDRSAAGLAGARPPPGVTGSRLLHPTSTRVAP